jgi:hypothetical protein
MDNELPLPTVDDYRRALAHMILSPNQKALLQAHYWAPDHTITMEALARAVGSPGIQGVGAQYERLAVRLGEALSWRGRKATFDIIGTAIPAEEGSTTDRPWVMRPELARALELQRWFRKRPRKKRRDRRP